MKTNKLLLKYSNCDDLIFTNCWMCDYETVVAESQYYKKYKKTRIVYGVLKNIQHPELRYRFVDIYDMFNFIAQNRRNNQIVYYHFLSFDGCFNLDWLGNNGFKAVENVKNNNEFSVFRTTGKHIYKIVVGIKNAWNELILITFMCSKEILSNSVKNIGESMEIDKFEMGQDEDPNFYIREPFKTLEEFEKHNMEYCLYCERDVDIVIKALVSFYVTLYEFMIERGYAHEFVNVRKCITIAGISFKLQLLELEKLGYDKSLLFINEYDERIIMDDFTNGGLTIMNEKYRKKSRKVKQGFMIDLQSAYPSIMRDGIPLGSMITTKPTDDRKYAHFITVKYKNIRAKNHTVPLLKNWNMKYRAHLYMLEVKGEYVTKGLDKEIELIEQSYEFDSKEIIFECWYLLGNPLKEYIEMLFGLRQQFKKTDKAKAYAFKILLNAGYGVHAKRFDYRSVVVERADDKYVFNKVEYKKVDNIDLNKKDNIAYVPNNRFVAVEYIDPQVLGIYHNKAIANYVTSMTHCLLIQGMYHFGLDHFNYSDTDSLILTDVEYDKVVEYCSNKLGGWEIETWDCDKGCEPKHDRFDEVFIGRSKTYELRYNGHLLKRKVAGVSHPDQMDFEDLKKHGAKIFKNAILRMQRVDGGVVLVDVAKHIKLEDVELKGEFKYGLYFESKK